MCRGAESRPVQLATDNRGFTWSRFADPMNCPPPALDGLPTRPIKSHSLDKLHYWGNYLQAVSTALKNKFPTRVCADLFAAFGVCSDKDGSRHWGSALLALQVATP